MQLMRPAEVVYKGRPYFRNSVYGRWCGLNCINNIVGRVAVSVDDFHKECKLMAKEQHRFGIPNRGSLTTGMWCISYLLTCYNNECYV